MRNPLKKFVKHNNSRQKCSACGNSIPYYLKRISFDYRSRYGGLNSIRICEHCIYKLSQSIDIDNVKEYEKRLVIEEL